MTARIENTPVAPPLYIDSTNQRVGVGNATPNELVNISGTDGACVLALQAMGTSPGRNSRLQFKIGTSNLFYFGINDADFDKLILGTGSSVGNNIIFKVATYGLEVGGTTDASAVLGVTSTTQGFLPPRMTTAQRNAIASPATGLIVYNTDTNKINVYTGAAWEAVTSA